MSRTKNFIAAIFASLVFLLAACNSNKEKDQHAHEAIEYTCPMHPQIVQAQPGSCPVCGMDLVKKSSEGSEVVITEELKNLVKPTNSSVVASIKTIHPGRKSLTSTGTASGIINYDTRRTYSVPVRFSGRIEKLFVKYNYQAVVKGQMIMEVYSPEMLTAQRELLYLSNEHKEDTSLLQSAKQKLMLLGLTDQQIKAIITSRKESFTLPVFSPYTGYIIESNLPANTNQTAGNASAMSGGMNASKNSEQNQVPQSVISSVNQSSSQQISIREGMYVTTGQSLFKIVDGSRLWAELYLPASQAEMVQQGNAIDLHVTGSDIKLSSHIDFIQPFFSEGNQFLQVRSYLASDKNKIRVGQLVTGQIAQLNKESLWIPREAVLDLGVQQIVFLKSNGTFTPIKVKTGAHADNLIEVKEGLEESSEIALNAQYLIDSESFIKVNNQ